MSSHQPQMRSGTRKRAAAAAAEGRIKRHIEDINRESDSEENGKENRAVAAVASSKTATTSTKLTSQAQKKAKHTQANSDSGSSISLSSYSSSSGETVSSDESSSNYHGDEVLTTASRQRRAHMARRAAREVNSSGTMYLSRRSIHRMKKGDNSSPMYSPLQGRRLTFSPEFHHRRRRVG